MSRLVTFALTLLCLGSLLSCGVSSPTERENPHAQELQQALDSSRAAGQVIGVSAAIIDAEGGVWRGVSGNSCPAHPITEDMLFDMGSAGKMLAAPLMLDLAEEGLLSLDDPIDRYIDPPPGVDGSIPIRLLLNHTSGLAHMVEHPDSPFRKPYNSIDFERWWTIDEIFTELGSEPYFAPGEGWHYSQAGYQISTLIVEKVTGSTMAEQIQSRLLDPLNIQDMILDFSKPLPRGVKIAHSWVDTEGDGSPEDVSNRSRNWIASLSRIYYYSTAEDFARWGHGLFTGQVLEPDSLDEMLTFIRLDEHGNEPPIFSGYGLGVLEWIPAILHGESGYGHHGSIPGYRAFLAHLPEHKLTIAVLSNSDKEEELAAIVDALLAVVLGTPEQDASPWPDLWGSGTALGSVCGSGDSHVRLCLCGLGPVRCRGIGCRSSACPDHHPDDLYRESKAHALERYPTSLPERPTSAMAAPPGLFSDRRDVSGDHPPLSAGRCTGAPAMVPTGLFHRHVLELAVLVPRWTRTWRPDP